MRELLIAYGNSCQAKIWSNKTIKWSELCDRLKITIKTSESVEEYKKMKKPDRDATKDKGGFVGGQLRDNRRKADTIVCRSMLTLDVDHAETDFINNFISNCPYAAALYTTHSHTPEEPRCRVIIPLTEDVSSAEYVALARFFANDWGIDQFDECSYKPNQLMYWPTTPANGEYIFKEVIGDWLDPQKYLAKHPNWENCSLLPTSSRESVVKESSKKPQEDPLSKGGVVGAFCRTYSIQKAIETFLQDIYGESAVDERYDYLKGEGYAGLVIYDDKYAYSHHATDPACGKLLNAFDLVRIHKFGDDDEKKSFKAMSEFAVKDEDVRLELIKEKASEAGEDFADYVGADWQRKITYKPKTGEIEDTVFNLSLILNNDSSFTNIAFNEMANRVEVTGPVPWSRPKVNKFWRDADTAQLKAYIDVTYGEFSNRNYDVCFTKVTDDRRFHPVRDYLDSLPKWDGVKRVESLFIQYLKAENCDYVKAATRKAFAAAVARIYEPGCKFDCILVLDGDQGIGKSTIVKDLVTAEYYSETLSLTDMDDKSGAEKLQGFWAVEIGELAGMKKADIEKVKAFLSTSDDKYRPSYGKVVESHPRQCIIIATVNGERGYLRDITGNRRFWVIKLHQEKQKQTWNFDDNFRAQFWAEAKALYEAGEKLYLEGDDYDAAEEAQRGAMEQDERLGIVEAYLETPLPDNWDSMDLYHRRDYLDDPTGLTQPKATHQRTEVCNAEIWAECFRKNPSELKMTDSYSISALMLQVDGWKRSDKSKRVPIYGKQRVYVRR